MPCCLKIASDTTFTPIKTNGTPFPGLVLAPTKCNPETLGVSKDFIPVDTVDMREKVGSVVYRKLIENLIKVQDYFITYTSPSCPLSGTFLSYRGSLLNY